MDRLARVLFAISTVYLAGCAQQPLADPPPPTSLKASFFDAASLDHERLARGGEPLKIGLALSGGGTKAAAFAHGVLHGLNDNGLLDHIDVISSASGGGYAAYWLMSKRIEALENPKAFDDKGYQVIFQDCFPGWYGRRSGYVPGDPQIPAREEAERQARLANVEVCMDDMHYAADRRLGDDPYRWQAHLLRWPDVFKIGYTRLVPEMTDNVPAFSWFAGVFSTLADGMFTPRDRDSYVASTYQYGIERAWGLNPAPRVKRPYFESADDSWVFTNLFLEDRWTRPMRRVDPATMKWQRLTDAYAKVPAGQPRLPLWVLNTTQGQKQSYGIATTAYPDPPNLFELTPFGYGSQRWGYIPQPPTEIGELSRAVRASAAFADAQGIGDATLAERVSKLSDTLTAAKWGIAFTHPAATDTLRLSDGGGADNLALVSAVRRGVLHVIVSDSAQDSRGHMGDLCWSKAFLEQYKFTVKFDALKNLDQVCEAVLAGKLKKEKAYDVDAWLNPVVMGTITWPPTTPEGLPTRQTITHVWLLKAGWDEAAAKAAFEKPSCGFGRADYNCILSLFWGTRGNEGGHREAVEEFPQHGTASQTLNGSPSLFLAYRELGRMAARQLVFDKATGGVKAASSTQHSQEPLVTLP